MSDFEEQTVNSLRTLFQKGTALRQISIRDIIEPDICSYYEQTLQSAYDARTTLEDALTSLGMKLEYEHWRLGGRVEELKPLMIDTPSPSDRIGEESDQP